MRTWFLRKARVDAAHIAIAAVHGMDYLLTWNCRHIANAVTRKRIDQLLRGAGYEAPVLCTPEELFKGSGKWRTTRFSTRVHRVREQLMAEAGGDIAGLFRLLRDTSAREGAGDRYVACEGASGEEFRGCLRLIA